MEITSHSFVGAHAKRRWQVVNNECSQEKRRLKKPKVWKNINRVDEFHCKFYQYFFFFSLTFRHFLIYLFAYLVCKSVYGVSVFMSMCTHALLYGLENNLQEFIPYFYHLTPGSRLRSSGLAASPFTQWVIFLTCSYSLRTERMWNLPSHQRNQIMF